MSVHSLIVPLRMPLCSLCFFSHIRHLRIVRLLCHVALPRVSVRPLPSFLLLYGFTLNRKFLTACCSLSLFNNPIFPVSFFSLLSTTTSLLLGAMATAGQTYRQGYAWGSLYSWQIVRFSSGYWGEKGEGFGHGAWISCCTMEYNMKHFRIWNSISKMYLRFTVK